ncbi:cysteine and histidine-rich domain-containing protein 1-like [Ptychodera flava]|uniref:cysteine and histidine-rich domain-containing protein 1-like n=1 Tax=Ptychodera flava TaxID=63121 RepID=UPI00396AA7BB
MSEDHLLLCFNKGCTQKYNPDENKPESCQHHPGAPIFHDLYKEWSCCKKKTRSFTDFLNIPGCKKGYHSNEKPPEPPKPAPLINVPEGQEVITVAPRKPINCNSEDRPSVDEPRRRLPFTVSQSLKVALEKQNQETVQQTNDIEEQSGQIKIGTSCKNNGCNDSYADENSNQGICTYHPGVPIFHEGMKYWSCCKRKTSDFNNFLAQAGCATGKHLWLKKDDTKKTSSCRYDWHQTGTFVYISVFSKVANPELTYVEANRVSTFINIVFGKDENLFQQEYILNGVIDPDKSQVTMAGAKVEVKLKKAEPVSWKNLEYKPEAKSS